MGFENDDRGAVWLAFLGDALKGTIELIERS
jgi:hypothetical protein